MSIAARRSHRGDEYQVAVAAHWVARLLSDETIDSVRVDAVALPGDGERIHVDDIVIGYTDGTWRFIQAKKNQPNHSKWTLADPVLRKELCKARNQLEVTPTGRVEFCSRSPFGDLAKLIEDGADYPDYAAFSVNAPVTLKAPLTRLSGILERDEPTVLTLLRRIEIGPHHDFAGWRVQTRALLQSMVTDPEAALDLIVRLVDSQQSGLNARADALRRRDLLAILDERGVLVLGEGSEEEDAAAFVDASRIGRHGSRTIAGMRIPRPELQQLIAWASAPETVSVLLTDGPGTGKTCLLLDFADCVEQRADSALLFIKGDQFARCATEANLTAAGLPTDLVPRAARLARHRHVVIVIDSLDVLSLHREHRSLRLFLTLIDRLERLPNLCIVTACRTFDLRYDPLLRERKWDKTLTLEPLDFETVVAPLLARQGIVSEGFSPEIKSLLAVPESLRLLVDSAIGGAAPAAIRTLTSAYQLQALYLEEVVRRDPLLGDPAMTAIQTLALRMMHDRTLRLPCSAVATDERRLQRLISQGVLAPAADAALGQAIGFGHQTLLDALAVRAALAAGQTLAAFILAHPPFPFLRPAVRGFAMHLRATDPVAFRRQLRAAVGEPGIAYHLKRVLIESLADLIPTDEDWPLIRHLWQAHQDLFRRLLWHVRHDEWFRLLHEHWWPMLGDESSDDAARGDFVIRLDRWMNRRPDDVLALWHQAIDSQWGIRLNLAWNIEFQLRDFLCWDYPGVESLLEALANRAPTQHRYLGQALSRYVDETGHGDETLWHHICRDVASNKPYRVYQGPHCSPHDFHREDFLVSRLSQSERFLDLAIATIDSWSEQNSEEYGRGGLHLGLLDNTEWGRVHSKQSVRPAHGTDFLVKALSVALCHHARKRTDWWLGNEPRLRAHRDLGVRYLLLLAYREDLSGNLSGIAAQLLDESLHDFSRFRYELGELANTSYHLLTAEVQDRHQEIILATRSGQDYSKEPHWRLDEVYQALLPIPAMFRSLAAREFIDRFRSRFGTAREAPQIFSWGGWVAPPVDLQRILALSDQALLQVLCFYTRDDQGRSQLQIEGLVGGRSQLTAQLADAAACAPHRFLDFVAKLAAEECHPSFIQSVLRGAATHLRYRFGNLQPSSSRWSPEQPLPDGPSLAERLLWFMDRYTEVWQDEWTAAQILEGCAVAAEGAESVGRLVWHLLRLARAKRPEQERVRFDPDKRTEVESRDLTMDAINEPRGIAATAAMELANRLAEGAEAWPELLTPLLRRLASDPVASVRAGILRDLPYLLHKQPGLGWDLLGRCLTAPHAGLWDLAGETFHYQLRDRFDQVAPYLDRMLVEAPGMADATWSRLSSLAVLEGKMASEDLFRTLSTLDRPALWEGAASVFSANIREKELVAVCRAGILRILDGTQAEEAMLALDRTLTAHVGFQAADMDLIARLIDRIAPRPEHRDFMGLPEWLASAARRDPIATLPLLESLVVKLNESLDRSTYLNGKPLIAALLEILREADDSDDRGLVARAIALQDRFLGLGLSGMDEMLEKATGR